MSKEVITVTTNTTPNSCVSVRCDCGDMWSMAQEFSYLRLSDKTGPFSAKLIQSYAVRARRISATYARLYLEQETFSDPSKKGRFYWMALGAFASKTVACTIEAWQVKAQAQLSDTTIEGLGKGNFWLFHDICGWHWYYAKHPGSFKMCRDQRNASRYVSAVKEQVTKLPWSADALPKIKQLAVSEHVKKGFEKVEAFETTDKPTEKRNIQYDHLIAIANHEQGVILQPLIYDDPAFAKWVKVQRGMNNIDISNSIPLSGLFGIQTGVRSAESILKWIVPDLELVFASACDTDDEKLKSVAPADTKLEDFKSRMSWIEKAAMKFHDLMSKRSDHMDKELQAMAGWVGMADEK